LIKILVDYREKKVLEYLNDIEAEVTSLAIGDYVISNKCAVERKTVRDFVSSIMNKRIFNQARELSRNYERPIIVVEGNNLFEIDGIHPNALLGALTSLILDYGITVISTNDSGGTARLITALAKKNNSEKNEHILRPKKKPKNNNELKKYFLEGLPYIGPKLTKRILKEFPTISEFLNSDEKEMKKIKGLGKKKIEVIRRIVHEEN